ncbi:MAG: DMT family transporter [Ahrensia sp.]|nr:DMT family transporter [Ahrensia sp.]
MSLSVFFIVLIAAVLHASWNAMVKSTGDKLVSMTAITLGHAPLALVAMPFVPVPPPESWPYLTLSVVVHTGYQLCLIMAYRLGDFTQVYPIARGSGPAIVTVFSIAVLGIDFQPRQILAIALVVCGIFCLAFARQTDGLRNPKAVGAALLTGCCIAGYSLLDGLGARVAGSAIGFVAWLTVINAIVFAIIVGATHRPALLKVATDGRTVFLLGGTASVAAYMLVVWAMTQAPIAMVTALRETSTIFALLLGVMFLGERVGPTKIIAVLLALAGVILLRISA